METQIKILILEHDPNDIGLLQYELRKSGLTYTSVIVQTQQDYESALSSFRPDIILSDFSLPSFDGLSAFHIKQNASPDTPFIIVSGTIGEEKAVELIKMGVTDYALKEKMYQISPKIQRALNEAAERKQKELAELQLRQREEHLQKIMNLSLDVICTIDEAGRFVTVGAASQYVWGYSPEELIGQRVIDLVYGKDKDKSYKAIMDLREGTDMVNFESRFVRKGGGNVTILWSARWDRDEKLAYAVARDATDIKEAEEKIRNNEKRFRTLLQNSNDGLALLTDDGIVIERSPTALRILELDSSETSGQLRSDLVHPDDLSILNEAVIHIKNKPQDILTVEYRFLTPSGNYKWIEVVLHNQLQEPAVGAIVLTFRDITERKLAEIALKESEEKYRDLFNLSPTPMWVFDTENLRFLDVNEAAIRHYGYTRDEFLGMTLKDIRPKEDVAAIVRIVREDTKAGSFQKSIHKHIKKSGEIISVEIQANTIEIDGKSARLVLATDVSERLNYISAIEEQNMKLREISWMQSHVVRAPVARMMGLINLLDNYQTEQNDLPYILNHIQSSANELDGIIRDIVRKTEQVNEQAALEEQAEQ